MPDWSYDTFLGPISAATRGASRRLLLRRLDAFGRSRLADPLFHLFGHMAPGPDLAVTLTSAQPPAQTLTLSSPVAVSADLPANDALLSSVSRFGVGLVEIGPVAPSARSIDPHSRSQLDRAGGVLHVAAEPRVLAAADVAQRLARRRASHGPVAIRIASPVPDAGAAISEAIGAAREVVEALAPRAALFTLALRLIPASWSTADRSTFISGVAAAARAHDKMLLVVLDAVAGPGALDPGEPAPASAAMSAMLAISRDAGAAGVWISGRSPSPSASATGGGGVALGRPARDAVREAVRYARSDWPAAILVAGGGIVEPADAVAALDAGADLVALDAGLALSGPGLPKRINEAIQEREQDPPPALWQPWPWTLWSPWVGNGTFGLVLMLVSLLATLVAATSVVLPYDEKNLGMTRDQLLQVNPHLLGFLTHDRVSFTATAASIAVLYLQLAYHGQAREERWARSVITVSALVGFASFFLFLRFGYLDPLHAVVWVITMSCFAWGMRRQPLGPPRVPVPDLHNDRAWHLAHWGQLGFIVIAVGLVGAGIIISTVACTELFVPTDLAFMGTTHAALDAANPRLLAMVAHDRAGFGGALAADGVAILLLALWGIRRGNRWVWWSLLVSGIVGFGGAIGVHHAVGYTDWGHMSPAYIGGILFAASIGLLWPYLGRSAPPSTPS